MKYALTYHHTTFEKDMFDEVIIKYNEINLHVVKFAQEKAKNVRLVLNVSEYKDDIEDTLDIIKQVASVHPAVAILLSLSQADFGKKLQDAGIRFFYDKIAETWDELLSLVYAGVSDIYVGSELGFEIKDVASVCHSRNIRVRVYPNVAQTSAPFQNLPVITSFFIRPEDLKLYEDYVDIIQFFGPLDRQRVLHQIYDRGSWMGKVSEIIIGGQELTLLNEAITSRFGAARLNCKKKCNQHKCELCNNAKIFAEALTEQGLVLKTKEREKNV